MCGLAGFLTLGGALESDEFKSILKCMTDTIIQRGPDAEGHWINEEQGIALGHRRLSILELSKAGAQPMQSACGRYVIAYNGEIYNHLALRNELKATSQWRGNSDTETLLEAISQWGVSRALQRSNGMFAFALWDKKEKKLILARDRMGEKPLYYGWQGEGKYITFLFGSDLAALKRHPTFINEVNRDALALYMRHNCIPAPYSIYKNIYKLAPASILEVSLQDRQPKIQNYWSLLEVAENGVKNPFNGTEKEAVDELEAVLKKAVNQQMLSDVPLGAFLSGGIDSSTIVSLMQSQSSRPVKTFTMGFNNDDYNEAEHAKAVAKHLGTEHTELYVTPQQALDVIPKLPKLYSEPFADSSQIPTFLVSQLARQHVTVSLSGDAGDELFAGYNRYIQTHNQWNKLSYLPLPLRKTLSKCIHGIAPKQWNTLINPLQKTLPQSLQLSNFGEKIHKAAGVLSSKDIEEVYLKLVTHWQPNEIVLGATEPNTYLSGNMPNIDRLNSVERMMFLDSITYLPDDILVKVDRAAMGASLETRAPFLDHRVIALAWQLPFELKLRNGIGKWALREVLYRYVPKELIERPKMGFGVPIDTWLRGPLKDWAEELLDENKLRQQGFFDPRPIRQKWFEHLGGKRNWQHHLWDVLMFQAWLEQQ